MDGGDQVSEFLTCLGAETPQSPVILSVPHAGRLYPDLMLAQSRLSADQLRVLEDRHVDTLVRPLAALVQPDDSVVSGPTDHVTSFAIVDEK